MPILKHFRLSLLKEICCVKKLKKREHRTHKLYCVDNTFFNRGKHFEYNIIMLNENHVPKLTKITT